MTIELRLSGEPAEIARLVAHLRDHFEVSGGDRSYPNRGSFGVRAYFELREPVDQNPPPHRVRSERVQPNRKEVEP